MLKRIYKVVSHHMYVKDIWCVVHMTIFSVIIIWMCVEKITWSCRWRHMYVIDILVCGTYFNVFFLWGCECKCLYCFVWVFHVDVLCGCFLWMFHVGAWCACFMCVFRVNIMFVCFFYKKNQYSSNMNFKLK